MTNVTIVGRPPQIYIECLQVLEYVAKGKVSAQEVLGEIIRLLLFIREEKNARLKALIDGISQNKDAYALSSEAIVTLISQHLDCRNSSRLPVLVVAGAYNSVSCRIGEKTRHLQSHNAADEQTRSVGDVEICVVNDEAVITAYEMKMKRVTIQDVDRAVTKIVSHKPQIENFVFITTDIIGDEVMNYATSMYDKLGGTEIVILDCIGFLRHFLHFFHRARVDFLDAYQELVLSDSDSAISQPLKEAFLILRQAAESDE